MKRKLAKSSAITGSKARVSRHGTENNIENKGSRETVINLCLISSYRLLTSKLVPLSHNTRLLTPQNLLRTITL